jgi:hypothetical protein
MSKVKYSVEFEPTNADEIRVWCVEEPGGGRILLGALNPAALYCYEGEYVFNLFAGEVVRKYADYLHIPTNVLRAIADYGKGTARNQQKVELDLFDLSNDLKMLKQLLREREVGFPTPAEQARNPLEIVETAFEHMQYLFTSLEIDESCPQAEPGHFAPCYPLGEGRMSEEEYKRRKLQEE